MATTTTECPVNKDIVKEEILPNFYVTLGVIIVSNLLVFFGFAFLGYLSAGYHFYEQIVHDVIDDEERKEREKRIQRIMEEQDLAWQMKKAKQKRQQKEALKPKMITMEEHEKEIRERRLSEQRLEDRVKESEKRVNELEDKLKKYQTKEKKRIQKIQVKKPEIQLKEGQKLLSGAVQPITPKKDVTPPETKTAIENNNNNNKGVRENANFNQKGHGLVANWNRLNQTNNAALKPKMSSTENNPSEDRRISKPNAATKTNETTTTAKTEENKEKKPNSAENNKNKKPDSKSSKDSNCSDE